MAKPFFRIEKNNKEVRLSAGGDLNTQYAIEIKDRFLQLLSEAHSVQLDFTEATAFDPSVIQLTYLLKRETARAGRTIQITLPSNAALNELLEKTGITKILKA